MTATTMPTSMTTTPAATAAMTAAPTMDPWVRRWLQAEGAAFLAAGLAGFLWLGLPWYAFLLLLVVPDVSMIGYLVGPRVGAITYNLGHSQVTALVAAGIGLAIGSVPVTAAGAILLAHSGMDRLMGYGLKLPTSFGDTHLGRIGKRRS